MCYGKTQRKKERENERTREREGEKKRINPKRFESFPE